MFQHVKESLDGLDLNRLLEFNEVKRSSEMGQKAKGKGKSKGKE